MSTPPASQAIMLNKVSGSGKYMERLAFLLAAKNNF
jgi:hypothetical protein